IDEGLLVIDLVHQPPRGQVGQPDADGVSVALGRQVEHDYLVDDGRPRFRFAFDPEPAGHVGIHADAADVFAHLFDDKDIEGTERQAGQEGFRLLEQAWFLPLDFIGQKGLYLGDAVVGVLDDGQAHHHVRLLKNEPGGGGHQFVVTPTKVAVNHLGTLLLAESYGQHLHQAAFDGAFKVRVGLDPPHDEDAVGAQGVPVEIDGDAVDPAHFLD